MSKFTVNLFYFRNINKETSLKFVHTSVHGVGHKFVQLAFKAFDLSPPFAVPEQKDPDPDFPTVKYPNPEEGKGVLVNRFNFFLIVVMSLSVFLFARSHSCRYWWKVNF